MKPPPGRERRRRPARGWSLPELALALLVAALLARHAVLPFEQALQRGRRASASAVLLEVSLRQERHHARQGRYAGSLAELGWPRARGPELAWPDARRPWYRLRLRAGDAAASPGTGYEAVAEPVGMQRRDACGSLRIDHLGDRGANLPGCW
ncbi:MAG: hypothetical protein KGJ03_01270 [Betaproteobacteria bacterium]|nr:hypothetical protein [Betaproteobacteria bacterium]MBU6511286.1 hypothetical protein [Betaproteobacteria bacterium]MDE1954328.1 hypothetical protein [Betaproteobacteria bacterium]MDE2152815.1 hypothetical protein [Betaproteobacteria bacterium]